MILVGSQRSGASQLAAHLMNGRDNEHVAVHELRGFMARSLHGAFKEAHAISQATKCKQFLFSLSVNPPRDAHVPVSELVKAINQAEERLGLIGQPRAIVIHEKEGRRHAHAVWSRIDGQSLTAVNMSFFKTKLNEISKSLYLEHGWDLPNGFKENGWRSPLNFTLAEWQQAKRIDLDPREQKILFRQAYQQSDGLKAFRGALEHSGYFLARGDRRGYVAVDLHGEVYSVARLTGIKTKALKERLGNPPDDLPSVDQAKAGIRKNLSQSVRSYMREMRDHQKQQAEPLSAERKAMVAEHRIQRAKLKRAHTKRWKAETRQRAERYRGGLKGVYDLLTGKRREIRRQNEAETKQAMARDRAQREQLFSGQHKARQTLQRRIEHQRKIHRQERVQLMRRVAEVLRRNRDAETGRAQDRKNRTQDYTLDR